MGFTALDYVIVVCYLIGIALIGVLSGGRQQSSHDYFLGGTNVPWWAACFAIVATETSTLTFISIPGLAYLTNLNFLQLTLGYVIGRVIVSAVLLPHYARGELSTAYSFLAARYGHRTRTLASITFMCTRIVADGVRLFATAIPLAILLRGSHAFAAFSSAEIYVVAIIVMAGITLVYTYIGGIRAVIWTDVVQMFIYLLGAITAGVIILGRLDGGFNALTGPAVPVEKLSILNFGMSFREIIGTAYTLPASLIGGAFLSMASHGTDQLIVQRLLTVRTLRGSQAALIGSGVIVMVQFAIFLLLGVLLYVFYGGASLSQLGLLKADEIFPRFIIEQMPPGLSGLIVAGLLAAAMSTLSGSINSLASSSLLDIYYPYFGRAEDDRSNLRRSRFVSLAWAIVLIGMAIFFIYNGSSVLVEIALGVASFTYGGLLGVFLLGVLIKRTHERDAMIGFTAGIATMVAVVAFGHIGWTWYVFVGTMATMLVGSISSLFHPSTV
jgi:SSS family solute:Na+ symporter